MVDGAKDVPVEITAVTDAFGYSCATSTGDYRQGDTKSTLTGDDVQTSLDLPFSFPSTARATTSAFVTSNGHLNFLAGTTLRERHHPEQRAPNAALYPFWDDLTSTRPRASTPARRPSTARRRTSSSGATCASTARPPTG